MSLTSQTARFGDPIHSQKYMTVWRWNVIPGKLQISTDKVAVEWGLKQVIVNTSS